MKAASRNTAPDHAGFELTGDGTLDVRARPAALDAIQPHAVRTTSAEYLSVPNIILKVVNHLVTDVGACLQAIGTGARASRPHRPECGRDAHAPNRLRASSYIDPAE